MPIDFEIQQGLRFVFTNLPNLIYICGKRHIFIIMFPKGLRCMVCNPYNGNICDGEEEGSSFQCPAESICSTSTCVIYGETQTIKQCVPNNSTQNLECQHNVRK